MKRTWKLTPSQKFHMLRRYRKGERVKIIAADYRVCIPYVCMLARRKGLEMRDRFHNRSAVNGS